MKTIYLYGAGEGCKAFLYNEYFRNKYNIKGIIDADKSKHGEYIQVETEDGLIENTVLYRDTIGNWDVDEIIITIKRDSVNSAADYIMAKGVSCDKIKVFDRMDTILYPFSGFSACNKLHRQYIDDQICYGLLQEYMIQGEFKHCRKICVIGEERDVLLIKDFFAYDSLIDIIM